MKRHLFSLSLLSFASLLPLAPSFTNSANACVMVDANPQVAIHPEGTTADQQSTSNMSADDNCFDNNTINSTTQVQMGDGDIKQTHQSDQVVGGGNINNTGLTTPTIKVPVNPKVDVTVPKEAFGH
jgi:hypothetical protein